MARGTLVSERFRLPDDPAELYAFVEKAGWGDGFPVIPPTEDQPGMILLLQSAADRAGVDPLTISPATPTAATDAQFSTMVVTLDTSGTYFALEEFLYNLETLPRAAKVTSVTLAPGTGPTDATTTETTTNELSGQFSVEFFTTDTSAGPNSVPGPSEDAEAPATEGGA